MDYFTTEINFLGITITKVGNKLETDLYTKPTDTHQYLRFKRICSTKEKLNNHLEKLKQWLLKRGYRENHVDSEIERIKLVKRAASFQVREKQS